MASFLSRLLVLALPVLGTACLADNAPSTQDAEVTSVENTNVKSQAIGDCWLYATAGWVESLHKGATAEELDMSEAYWDYWYWYEQITGSDITLSKELGPNGLLAGGGWPLGAELIQRYGWMHEADFAPATEKAARDRAALLAVNASIAGGALSTPSARRDPKIVRAELDKAWGLGRAVIAEMERAFPTAAPPASLTDRAANGALGLTLIHAPQEMAVLGSDGAVRITLADAIGHREEGTDLWQGHRVGDEAWSAREYTWTANDTVRRRAFLKNIQSVLNRRLAVPIDWLLSGANAREGVYRAENAPRPNVTSSHASIFVDYEVEDVPGFGTLGVETRETRPEALEAALDDAATVTFFRIKNSWGVAPMWTAEEIRQQGGRVDPNAAKPNYLPAKAGYNDLFLDYLDLSWDEPIRFLTRVVLPAKLRFEIPEPTSSPAP